MGLLFSKKQSLKKKENQIKDQDENQTKNKEENQDQNRNKSEIVYDHTNETLAGDISEICSQVKETFPGYTIIITYQNRKRSCSKKTIEIRADTNDQVTAIVFNDRMKENGKYA